MSHDLRPAQHKIHGTQPVQAVVVHGGPGAPGSVTPLAQHLGQHIGVLEPFQTAYSVDGQVEELHQVIDECCDAPIMLIGWSWGACLSILTAARHPEQVQKLILVGCGPLREEHALGIWETRMSRLDERGQVSAAYLANVVSGDVPGNQAVALAALELTLRACDTYATLEQAEPAVTADADIYAAVWPQATALRQAGGFEAALSQVRCPVLAIHGDYDPHPIDGIRIPLADTCPTARIITLARCGHTPWDERHARDAFFEVLERETRSTRQ